MLIVSTDPPYLTTDPGIGARTFRVLDQREEADGAPVNAADRAWCSPSTTPRPTIVLSWFELLAVNEPETMMEIVELAVGERTILGMCDPIERVS